MEVTNSSRQEFVPERTKEAVLQFRDAVLPVVGPLVQGFIEEQYHEEHGELYDLFNATFNAALIEALLDYNDHNRSQTARDLAITRNTLYLRMKGWQVQEELFPRPYIREFVKEAMWFSGFSMTELFNVSFQYIYLEDVMKRVNYNFTKLSRIDGRERSTTLKRALYECGHIRYRKSRKTPLRGW